MSTPQQLGKYRILSVLGEGAMGVVYKGFDPGIQRTVALKTIRRDLALSDGSGASAQQRFRVEAQAAGRLSHPGIVAVYDFGEEGDLSYIAMEFIEGSSLSRYNAKGKVFPDDDVASIAAQLLDALDHSHSHGVWHRDIKPANVLITHEGKVKVADFGVARIEHNDLTVAGSVIGTPGYMAPEQFLGEPIDSRVDIYATGVLLYQLLVGRPPFSGNTESLLYRVVHEPPVLPTLTPGYARHLNLDEVVGKALAKDRRNRFASPAAFKQELLLAFGRPVAPKVSQASLFSPADVPTEVVPMSPSKTSSALPPAHWDPALLQQVEAKLAKHVGPMAAVLVRRSARACHDLPTLYEHLAEQLTNAQARAAFLTDARAMKTNPSGGMGPGGTVSAFGGLTGTSLGIISDSLIAACAKILTAHLGPIAPVVARRSAAKAPSRSVYFDALEGAIADPAKRKAVRAQLDKLP
ncbi:MAG: serine/threonine protein kinase [Rubrivivax sp.]|nr:serine/threonine protein kinase [Rubrivivax sp.]